MKGSVIVARFHSWHQCVASSRAHRLASKALRSMPAGANPVACRPVALKRGRLPLFKDFLRLGAGALLLLSTITGCATLQVVPAEKLHGQQFAEGTEPIAHIYAANWGWYLLKYIPLVTGNLDKPGVPRLPVLLTDNVRVDLLVDKVAQESQRQGGSIISDVRTRDRSLYLWWTLFVWLNEFEVSANASRPDPSKAGSPVSPPADDSLPAH
ncbi:hypothetical protein YTPLAS18_28510 [Nitrospira sp.]|nr:hypothetical protein YTPLAS18_28510 [Nitrospira sp.]